MSKLGWKILSIALTVGLAVYFLFPTFEWYSFNQREKEKREARRDSILGKILNLGLDLKGGSHLVLEVQTDELLQAGEDYQTKLTNAVNQAIEVIRNRVDQFGVAEPLIARQGAQWIVVQLPGIKDPERAKQLIGKTALLEFRLVDDSPALENISTALRNNEIAFSSAAANPELLSSDIRDLFPAGYTLMPERNGHFYLVQSTPELTGAYLTNAKVQLGNDTGFGYPSVSLEFNPEGAKIFSKITEMNIGRNLAIVLDGIVQSAPTIRSRIADGQAVIEGSFSSEDAKLLATVLRAGALPAPVEIIEERTVGPQLGEDSIRAGVTASLAGLFMILIFMIVYYKESGFVADVALILNLVLLMGSMAYFKATLTLPGIAGVILSLALAVDANVLILERVREELLKGKNAKAAINYGYTRAFSAILDSNLTTLIAALFLFQFGTGPVKGFAVTLTIGIVISMFTAIFVTRTYYDWRFQNREVTHIGV
jgi:protein-export membrane protein SecD